MAPGRSALLRTVIGGVVLLNLLIAALLALVLQQSHGQYQRHAVVTAQNLSIVLKENISATVREIDVALRTASEDIEPLLAPAPGHGGAIDALLAQMRQRQPELLALRLYDAGGRLSHGTPLASGETAATGLDYFQALRDNSAPGLALSPPMYDDRSGRWSVVFARGLRTADGGFGGVLAARVDLQRLTSAFALVEVGPHGAMTLSSSDEQVYARYSSLQVDPSLTGKSIKSVKLRDYVASGVQPAAYMFQSKLDGVERLISLRRIFDQPVLLAPRNLYFSVGLASADYLQKWYEELYVALALMLLSLTVSGGAALTLLRFWRERSASLEQVRALERERAVNDERLRIVQDLHDGVGSQLLSTLMMVQSGGATQAETVGLLQECMDDMRLAIDSLSPDEPDLLPVLGNFRYRMEARFKGVGLQLRWTNHALPDSLAIAPHDGLQVLRVLQEALANVLRHAQASLVTVDLHFSPQQLSVRIRDNGIGFAPADKPTGHGLANMRSRAAKIGAALHIYRLQSGTALDFDLPLEKL
ncbi:ATP-binding protein [Rugamonas sp.]|uniref:cache domain-containing sensor histidine kinase n=1 Tax=Rugamonas sp. TaxID=1926287 RepID=UPI0025E5F92D|nr:ATP-binding protein [Rugamonas sp.]